MLKKSSLLATLSIAFLLPATTYSQNASPSPSAKPAPKASSPAADYSSLSTDQIIEKLQGQIIAWQDDIIKGIQVRGVSQSLLRDMAEAAVDDKTNGVKDQKMLDLLSKYGVGITTKDGKKLNTASTQGINPAITPEAVPYIEVPKGATSAQKSLIRSLLEKAGALVDPATQANESTLRLQAVVLDVVALAKDDESAQALVKKYNIRQDATPSPTP